MALTSHYISYAYKYLILIDFKRIGTVHSIMLYIIIIIIVNSSYIGSI